MKYQFVHRSLQDWTTEEAASLDTTLEFILQYDRDNPFLDIATHICRVANLDYTIIAEILPDNMARTLAYVGPNSILENIEYSLLGTPCENVIGHNTCYYPEAVQQQFPMDEFLRYLNIKSYLGTALNDKHDNTIGFIALLSCMPMKNPTFIEYLLATVTPFLEEKLTSYRVKGQK